MLLATKPPRWNNRFVNYISILSFFRLPHAVPCDMQKFPEIKVLKVLTSLCSAEK